MPNRIEATLRKPRQQPPGDYSHCACSRLHPSVRHTTECRLSLLSVLTPAPVRTKHLIHDQMLSVNGVHAHPDIPRLNLAARPCFANSQSNATRETNTDVNKLVISPRTSVVANPFTGGVPKKNRKKHDTTVVT